MFKLRRKQWRFSVVLLSLLIIVGIIVSRQFSSGVDSVASDTNSTDSITEMSAESGVLTIWWYKGYVKAEKTYLEKIVSDWEKANSKKVRLVFFEQEATLDTEITKAVATGATPDIAINHGQLVTSLARSGKLKEVSLIIKPIASSFPDSVLNYAYQYNNVTKEKSYYAIPIYQEGVNLHYWQDLVERAGYSETDIPQDWDGFWQFWLDVQQQLRSQQQEVFALGFNTYPVSSDTFLFFEQILEAYNVKILDDDGKLLLDRPETRQGIVRVLNWWTQLYEQGYIPPSALVWENPDNNFGFHNQVVAMTPNPTLSIPAARAAEPEVYRDRIGTIPYPNKPSGEPMTYLTKVRQVVVFADRNYADAKSFLSYFIQPQILGSYIEAAGGRFFPVNKNNWDDPFWNNPDDPHISTVRTMFVDSPTRSHYFSDSPAYVEVLEANVWGRALYKIITRGKTPENAADEAIAEIQQIFAKWQ